MLVEVVGGEADEARISTF